MVSENSVIFEYLTYTKNGTSLEIHFSNVITKAQYVGHYTLYKSKREFIQEMIAEVKSKVVAKENS